MVIHHFQGQSQAAKCLESKIFWGSLCLVACNSTKCSEPKVSPKVSHQHASTVSRRPCGPRMSIDILMRSGHVIYGAFLSHGGTPIAGWFMDGKSPTNGWIGRPPIWGNLHVCSGHLPLSATASFRAHVICHATAARQVSTDHDSRGSRHLSTSKSHLQGFLHHLFIHMPLPAAAGELLRTFLAKVLVASREVEPCSASTASTASTATGQSMEDLETTAAGGFKALKLLQHQDVLEKMVKKGCQSWMAKVNPS